MAKMTITHIDIEKATEQIRQERETFDQRKKQDKQWFILKLVMGFFAVILLAAVLVISFYILLNNDKFPSEVVISAGGALFVDILGLIISVWKIVLNPNSITKLEPVTKIENE
jgi:putative flippase GtrA